MRNEKAKELGRLLGLFTQHRERGHVGLASGLVNNLVLAVDETREEAGMARMTDKERAKTLSNFRRLAMTRGNV